MCCVGRAQVQGGRDTWKARGDIVFLVQEVTLSLPPPSCFPLFPFPQPAPFSSFAPFLPLFSGRFLKPVLRATLAEVLSSPRPCEGPLAELMACPEQEQSLWPSPFCSLPVPCIPVPGCFQFGHTGIGQTWVGLQVTLSVTPQSAQGWHPPPTLPWSLLCPSWATHLIVGICHFLQGWQYCGFLCPEEVLRNASCSLSCAGAVPTLTHSAGYSPVSRTILFETDTRTQRKQVDFTTNLFLFFSSPVLDPEPLAC